MITGASFSQAAHLTLTWKFITEHYALTIFPLAKNSASLYSEKDSLRTEAANGGVL